MGRCGRRGRREGRTPGRAPGWWVRSRLTWTWGDLRRKDVHSRMVKLEFTQRRECALYSPGRPRAACPADAAVFASRNRGGRRFARADGRLQRGRVRPVDIVPGRQQPWGDLHRRTSEARAAAE